MWKRRNLQISKRGSLILILNSMIENHSVNLNVVGKHKYLSLPKESCQISDDKVD